MHRDIKPGNILIDDEDNVKLSDFGVSEMMDSSKKTKNKAGTRYYLPPEIFQESLVSAGAIDIWSMGITLFYFTHGKIPFDAVDIFEFKKDILNKEPKYDRSLDPQLINLMRKCLEKNPEKRVTIEKILEDEWLTYNHVQPLINLPEASRI